MIAEKRQKPTTSAYEAEKSEGGVRIPKFVSCPTCGNTIIRDRPCWYCDKEPAKA